MSDINKYLELVGAYVDGELPDAELQSFETELATNKTLQQEVASQSELVEGIKLYRKAELIARLDQLVIPAPSLLSGSATKFIAGIIILGGISFGIYQFTLPEADSTIVVDQISTETEVPSETAPQTPEIEEAVVEKESTTTSSPVESTAEKSENETSTPDVIMPAIPEPVETQDEMGEEDLEIPSTSLGVEEMTETGTMAVEIIDDKAFNFHYQVIEGKLVLYGNFSEEPYQIIEINVEEEKQWYLYFQDNYYAIDKHNSTIVPLDRITSTSLINELDKRKNNGS